MTRALVLVLAVFASAVAEPLLFRSPYLGSPFASPFASPFSSPYTSAALVAPGGAVVGPAGPVVASAAVPLSSVSAYSYGSSYSIQDYAPLVNSPAAPLYSSAYSLPYTYADWFYRR